MKALQTLVASKSIKGTSFVSVRNYENSKNEISNQTFLVGISYANLLNNDLMKLQSKEVLMFLEALKLKYVDNAEMVDKAYNELVTSLKKRTLSELEKEALRKQNDETIKRSDAQKDAYINVSKGLRIKDDSLYIYGLLVRKTILKKGEYKNVKSQTKTLIKKEIKKFADLKELKYRNFKLGQKETLKMQGFTI